MEPADEGPLPFWFGDNRPAATEAQIDDCERHIGRSLPAELRRLLLVQDGGVSNFAGFEDGERYFPVFPIFGAGGATRTDTLMRAFDQRRVDGVPDGIIMIAGEGHSWLGLDYRVGVEPAVVFRQTDEDLIEVVARTFAEFLAGLIEE